MQSHSGLVTGSYKGVSMISHCNVVGGGSGTGTDCLTHNVMLYKYNHHVLSFFNCYSLNNYRKQNVSHVQIAAIHKQTMLAMQKDQFLYTEQFYKECMFYVHHNFICFLLNLLICYCRLENLEILLRQLLLFSWTGVD